MTTPAQLSPCVHCNCCLVGMRQITAHENQSGCPPEGITKWAVACALCGVQGPTDKTREGARTMWEEWYARLQKGAT